MPKISVAHSPDADDIFMYYAIKFGWANTGDLEFDNIALDIETLNEEALKGTYDATAISFGAYPFMRDDYALLRCAMSFGPRKITNRPRTTDSTLVADVPTSHSAMDPYSLATLGSQATS